MVFQSHYDPISRLSDISWLSFFKQPYAYDMRHFRIPYYHEWITGRGPCYKGHMQGNVLKWFQNVNRANITWNMLTLLKAIISPWRLITIGHMKTHGKPGWPRSSGSEQKVKSGWFKIRIWEYILKLYRERSWIWTWISYPR